MQVRVTQLEQFRLYQEDEELSLGWLLNRLSGQAETTEKMQAGTAFHKAIELAIEGELGTLASGDYRFDFNCDCVVQVPTLKELEITKQYGDLTVVGHTDGIIGKEVIDYKTTQQFDPDRLMSGYQWRYYLDMLDCDSFCWQVFVVRDFGPPGTYEVKDVHTLRQKRYPGLHDDCLRLANEYAQLMRSIEKQEFELCSSI